MSSSEKYDWIKWIKETPKKRERFADVLRYAAQSPPARDISGAHAVMDKAFDAIESQVPDHPDTGYRMYVHPLSQMEEIEYAHKRVFVDVYEKHILFLGENGSIEVRLAESGDSYPDSSDDKSLAHPYANLKVIFEKAGADGRYVWDAPTS